MHTNFLHGPIAFMVFMVTFIALIFELLSATIEQHFLIEWTNQVRGGQSFQS